VSLDILCGFLLVALIGLGYRSGAIAQGIRLGGLVAAFLLAPRLADLIGNDEPVLHWAITALAFSAIYTVVAIIGHFVLSRDKGPGKWDRLAGAGLGLVKACVIASILAASLNILSPNIREIDPKDRLHLQDSMILAVEKRVENLLGL